MVDYKALCAEMLCSLEQYPVQPPRDRDLVNRARAALAEPDSIQDRIAKADAAIEASMEKIRTIAATPALALQLKAEGAVGPTAQELRQLWAACNSPSVFARAVLARWGSSAQVTEPTFQELRQIFLEESWPDDFGTQVTDLEGVQDIVHTIFNPRESK